MTLQLGEWRANVNGKETLLSIGSVDSRGTVTGFIAEAQIAGFWDEGAKFLTFSALIMEPPHIGEPPKFSCHVYRAHLFRTPPEAQPG